MTFALQLRALGERAIQHRSRLQSREEVLRSLVYPLFQLLGYDVFDPDVMAVIDASSHAWAELILRHRGQVALRLHVAPLETPLDDDLLQALHVALQRDNLKLGLLTDGRRLRFLAADSASALLSLDLAEFPDDAILPLRRLRPPEVDLEAFVAEARTSGGLEPGFTLEQVELRDFGVHHHTTIKLGRFTLLVGPNGVGKTTVLKTIERLLRGQRPGDTGTLAGVFQQDVGGGEKGWMRRVARGQAADPGWTLTLEGRAEQQPWGLTFTGRKEEGHLRASSWWYWGDARTEPRGGNDASYPPRGLEERLRPALYLHLRSEQLERPVPEAATFTQIQSDGYGLASVLAQLRATWPEREERVVSALREVYPRLRRVRLRRATFASRKDVFLAPLRAEEPPIHHHELLFDFADVVDVPTSMVSEGVLIVLGILTALWSPSDPRILLLDNLEQGLHPAAQAELVKQLRVLLRWFPELQIVATTHSPYLVDAFAAEEVWVMGQGAEGVVGARRLSEHPDVARLRAYMSTGELWSHGGEVWAAEMT